MKRKEFLEHAIEAGFSSEQAEFLERHLAKNPHVHQIDDVEGLGEALWADEDEDEADDDEE